MINDKLYNIPCFCSKCGCVYQSGIQLVGDYIRTQWPNGSPLKTEFDCPKCGTGNRLNTGLIDFIETAIDSLKDLPIDVLLGLQRQIKIDQKGLQLKILNYQRRKFCRSRRNCKT